MKMFVCYFQYNDLCSFNSTAIIQRESCDDLNEPVCEEKDGDEYCEGPFILSGKIRSTMYPEIRPVELASVEFNHTYCARADVYHDIDGSGKQSHIAFVKRVVVVTYKGRGADVNDYLVDLEEDTSEEGSGSSKAALIGLLIGIVLVVPVIAFFLLKKRNGGTKIHDSTNIEDGTIDIADDSVKSKDLNDFEIV